MQTPRLIHFATFILTATLALGLAGCAVKPKGGFLMDEAPPPPDYALSQAWAALPQKRDSADLVPDPSLQDRQSSAAVDVFFLHPTTYTGRRGQKDWNADIRDASVNLRTDKTAIRYQASLFNGAGRVFAPRYRQAHLQAFYTKHRKADANRALELAYVDVKTAFEYYLNHYNEGRPIIFAAHSQGTLHAARLLREYFDGKALADRLVVAYLVGMPVRADYFDALTICNDPEETGCYCTWRTVREDFIPKKWQDPEAVIIVTNPLTWCTDDSFAESTLNDGAVLKEFHDGLIPGFTGAQVQGNWLWVPRPKIPGVPVLLTRNYHVADFNFFYVNVRDNAQLRAETYFHKRP